MLSIFLLFLPVITTAEYCMPTQPCWPKPSEINALRFRLGCTGGKLLKPGDNGWPGNNMFNSPLYKAPGLIADVITKDQVILSLSFAYKYNIRVSLYSTGHEYLGRSIAEGSLQISVKQMKNIKFDLSCQQNKNGGGCMTVEAGVQWSEAYKKASETNRMTVGGYCTSVGVTGWTLGGGHSPFVRKFGLGIQNVLEFHLITSDLSEVWTGTGGTTIKKIGGSIISSNDTSLYYALRGGGSSFGVVLDLKFRVHKDREIEALECLFPAFLDGTPRVFDVLFKTFREFMMDAPAEFGLYFSPVIACKKTDNSCEASVLVLVNHHGTKITNTDWFVRLDTLLSSLNKQGVSTASCTKKTHSNFHAFSLTFQQFLSKGSFHYLSSALVQKPLYSNQTIDVIVRHVNESYHAFTNISLVIVLLGGAVHDISLSETPLNRGWKDSLFLIFSDAEILPNDPDGPNTIERIKDSYRNLEPYSMGAYYNEMANDMNPDEWKRKIWGLENYMQLVEIKKTWDPLNRFTCHQCVGQDLGFKEKKKITRPYKSTVRKNRQ